MNIAQYTAVSAEAERMAREHQRVYYVEDTEYGYHVTTDATNAIVAINQRGERQYLKGWDK